MRVMISCRENDKCLRYRGPFEETQSLFLHIVFGTARVCFQSHPDRLQCKYSLGGTMLMRESTGTHRFAQIPADIFNND